MGGLKKIRGWMGIPMITQDKVVGFINLDSHRVNAFTERDAMLAQTFANSAAVAIQNAILFPGRKGTTQARRVHAGIDAHHDVHTGT